MSEHETERNQAKSNTSEEDSESSRRGILKKAVYSTPTLLGLSVLLNGADANGQPPCDSPPFGCPPSLDQQP